MLPVSQKLKYLATVDTVHKADHSAITLEIATAGRPVICD